MTISQLSLTDFRNLRSTTLEFDPAINLIYGGNGSGKTSLLESIYVLCQACSFSTYQLKQCINHDKTRFLLFGRFSDYKAGISRSEQKQEIKLNGELVKRRSELVSKTPIGIANANSIDLVMGPPQQRRAYIDWCLFHVKHQYVDYWAQFRHALKQRNRLLKKGQDLNLLEYWNEYLVKPSLFMQQHRQKYIERINTLLGEHTTGLLGGLNISMEYLGGRQPAGQDSNIVSMHTKIGIA